MSSVRSRPAPPFRFCDEEYRIPPMAGFFIVKRRFQALQRKLQQLSADRGELGDFEIL
jgi:hypothetical protein